MVIELPKIIFLAQEWNWEDLISYYKMRYGKTIKLYSVMAENVLYRKAAPFPNAMPHISIFPGMMGKRKASFAARYASRIFLRLTITGSQKILSLNALTAALPG